VLVSSVVFISCFVLLQMMFVAVVLVFLSFACGEDRSCIAVYGYSSCAYFQRASCWSNYLKTKDFSVANIGGTRDEYQAHLARLKPLHSSIDPNHRTSPLVMRGCEKPQYVGGSDDFVKMMKAEGKGHTKEEGKKQKLNSFVRLHSARLLVKSFIK
jgi:hypothetical protein